MRLVFILQAQNQGWTVVLSYKQKRKGTHGGELLPVKGLITVHFNLIYVYKAHYHRTFYCEITDSQQPFAIRVPPREARLPTEPTLESMAGLNSTPETTGGFACLAQAAWLLDEVFKAIEVTDLDTRLTQLDGLNHTLRTVLAVVMDKDQGAWGSFCAANMMIIR